jgi:hypothetical protein
MNQQQNQSQGDQSQRQGSQSGDRGQQQQGLPDKVGQGDHLIDEDDGIPGSDQDAANVDGRQQEQSSPDRAQQDDPSRTGSEAERI